MKIYCSIALLFSFCAFQGIAYAGQDREEKVINIESAMRAVQERHLESGSSSPVWWWPNKELIEPGPYPSDGFYCDDLLDPEFAAARVEDLFYAVSSLNDYIDPDLSSPESPVLVTRDLWDHYPDDGINASNYEDTFLYLVRLINKMTTIRDWLSDPSYEDVDQHYGNSAYLDVERDGENTCSGERDRAGISWDINDSMSYVSLSTRRSLSYPLLRQRQFDSSGGYLGSVFSVTGSYSWSGRYNGTARIYLGVRQSLVGIDDFVGNFDTHQLSQELWSDESWIKPMSLQESLPGDGNWVSPLLGPTDDESKEFSFDCSGFESAKTVKRRVYWIGTVFIDLDISSYINERDFYRSATDCSSCAVCSACDPGTLEVSNECVKVVVGLGAVESEAAGSLEIFAIEPNSYIARPEGIVARLNRNVKMVSDSEASLRTPKQIVTPQAVLNIESIDEYSYCMRFYYPSSAGAEDEYGILEVSGDPYKTITVENMDRQMGNVERLLVTSESSGNVDTYAFQWQGGEDWELVSTVSGVTTSVVRNTVEVGLTEVETVETRSEDGDIVRKVVETFQVFPWNQTEGSRRPSEIISRSVGSAEESETTEYFYWDDPLDVYNYGRLKLRIEPNGFWEKTQYDSKGRVLSVTSPFLNAPPESVVGVRVLTTTVYDELNYEETIERVDLEDSTFEVARSYRMFDWGEMREIETTVDFAEPEDPSNLVTAVAYHSFGEGKGKLRSRIGPDGIGVLYLYDRIDGLLVKTTDSGVFDESGYEVIDGQRLVQTINSSGIVVSEVSTDIVSGIEYYSWVATENDDFGRVLRRDYSDGTFLLQSYGCCGIEYEIDREGIRTDYSYQGKLIRSQTRAGVTTRYDYDSAGRVVRTVRIGANGSEVERSQSLYDTLGEIRSLTEYGTRHTLFTHEYLEEGGSRSTTVEADGATRIETYARDGSLLSVRGTAVAPVDYEYGIDELGSWVREIRPDGDLVSEWVKTWTDKLGNTVQIAYPDGAVERFEYDTLGRLKSQTDADGIVILYEYDSKGRRNVVAIDVNKNGAIDYDGVDRITRTNTELTQREGVPVNRVEVMRWETLNSDVPTVIQTRETSVDGRILWTEAFGVEQRVETSYPEAAKRLVQAYSANGTRTEQEFENGRLVERRIIASDDTIESRVEYTYDGHGRLIKENAAGVGITRYTYSAADQIVTLESPDPDPDQEGEGFDSSITQFTYDNSGRLICTVDDVGGEAWRSYWPNGQLKRSWGGSAYPVEYDYTEQGRLASLKTWQDFEGDSGVATTLWTYDSQRGFLTGKLYQDGNGPTYGYSLAGRLKSRTWARGLETSYEYDQAGALTRVSYDDTLTPEISYQYDRLGRVAGVTDGTGTRSYQYESGLPLSEIFDDGAFAGWSLVREVDYINRLSSLRLLNSGAVSYAVDYGYDPRTGRLDRLSYKDISHFYRYESSTGRIVGSDTSSDSGVMLERTNTWDHLGRLKTVESSSVFGAITRSYGYDQLGRRISQAREDGRKWRYAYDSMGQLTSSRLVADGDAPVAGYQFGFEYDDIGNRLNSTENSASTNYQVDLLNQLSTREAPGVAFIRGEAAQEAEVAVNDQAAQRDGRAFFAQVPVDNTEGPRLFEVSVLGILEGGGESGSDAISEQSGAVFVPAAGVSYSYDSDGNLLSDDRWTYTWNGENRLVAMESSEASILSGAPVLRLEFAYDYLGRRVAKNVFEWNDVVSGFSLQSRFLFLYDGWNLIAEFEEEPLNSAITLQSSYVWGLDLGGTAQGAGGVGGLLAVESDGLSLTPCYDGNGNIVSYVDLVSGSIAANFEYGPFGETISEQFSSELFRSLLSESIFRFSTSYEDVETGLLYYGYRYYDSKTGRWPSRDPIGEAGGLNLYGMVGNDPLSKYDILGLSDEDVSVDEQVSVVINQLIEILYEIEEVKDGCTCSRVKDALDGFSELMIKEAGLEAYSLAFSNYLSEYIKDVREFGGTVEDETQRLRDLFGVKVIGEGALEFVQDFNSDLSDIADSVESVGGVVELAIKRDAFELLASTVEFGFDKGLKKVPAVAIFPLYHADAIRGIGREWNNVVDVKFPKMLTRIKVACSGGSDGTALEAVANMRNMRTSALWERIWDNL